jgi:hypothetical protein
MRGAGGGPKTEKGQAIARINALKHGMTSNSPVIPEMEDEDAWQRHLRGFLESFAPDGFVEEFLVKRLATLGWRFHRCTRSEVAATMRHIQSTAMDLGIAANYLSGTDDIVEPSLEKVTERQLGRLLPADGDLDRIMRYETTIHRQFLQTLHELEALQARRRGERTPLGRFDFSAPPAVTATSRPVSLPKLAGLDGA